MRNEIIASKLCSAKRLHQQPRSHRLLAGDFEGIPLHHRKHEYNEERSRATSLESYISLRIPWAVGSGNRQMCGMDKYGFPLRHRQRQKRHFGFQTGDMVRATVASGKYAGIHTGRVLVRATGSFDIRTKQGRVQGISHRTCTPVHRCDGYSYQKGDVA